MSDPPIIGSAASHMRSKWASNLAALASRITTTYHAGPFWSATTSVTII